MRRHLAAAALAAALLAGGSTAGRAGGPMVQAGPTLPPAAFIDFCRQHAADCAAVEAGPPVRLDAARRAELEAVNTAVNREVAYVSDRLAHGRTEVWSYPVASGDCEDLALEKRRRLIAMGWPADALLLAVAMVPRVGGHAVLVAVTDEGDYILDSLRPHVVAWSEVAYRWVKRQSRGNPLLWVGLKA